MKLTRPANLAKKCLASVARVQNVLNAIIADEIHSHTHRATVGEHYSNFTRFRDVAIDYGMVELIEQTGIGKGMVIRLRKTHTLPEFDFTTNPPPVRITQAKPTIVKAAPKKRGRKPEAENHIADANKMVKAKTEKAKTEKAKTEKAATVGRTERSASRRKAAKQQGDGSVLKPKFNHSIEPARDRHQLDHFESYGPSRIEIMRKIEDIGGYQPYMRQSNTENRRVHQAKGRY
ncbi:hypothetical protein [Chitinibacter sp. GC72]|uniref:hypothetical protein n=1 Tax=Chitinibacter sp. GC72 TaxID=1526917 RepID=UPI0012FB4A49|nr:hypothetical protein [Chitinibacter sp. GC72]